MKKIIHDYGSPIATFLFCHQTVRKELDYENDILGGAISFTS